MRAMGVTASNLSRASALLQGLYQLGGVVFG